MRGDELDVLARFSKVISQYPEKSTFIRATADNPEKTIFLNRFILLIHSILKLDYSGVNKLSFNCFEFISRRAIEKAVVIKNTYAHEHVTPLMYEKGNPLDLRRMIYPRRFLALAKGGITIDTPEDFEKAKLKLSQNQQDDCQGSRLKSDGIGG